MHAAIVHAFDTAPVYGQRPDPVPASDHELVVEVLAAGLHPRVRSQASGSHYTSDGALPLVPGIDGVGRDTDGRLRYFILPDTNLGSMAERTVIDIRRSVVLPAGTDPVAVAAAMNPVMSSWLALRRRISFQPGQDVLVLGATGNAGRMAVQVARFLGAGRIVGAGRDAARLAALPGAGATTTVSLAGPAEVVADGLAAGAADVDVVLDYLWGAPSTDAMIAIVTGRSDRDRPLTWVEIGSVAGLTAEIPSAALRAAKLQLVGSGQGSVSTADIVRELPAIAEAITSGAFDVNARAVPLPDVERAWTAGSGAAERIVITPRT